MEYTIEALVAFNHANDQYQKRYGITSYDLKRVNDCVKLFHSRMLNIAPQGGDVIEVHTPFVIYDKGHIDSVKGDMLYICSLPVTPGYNDEANFFSTSGSDWFESHVSNIVYLSDTEKTIKIWGTNGRGRAEGTISFNVPCKKWKVTQHR